MFSTQLPRTLLLPSASNKFPKPPNRKPRKIPGYKILSAKILFPATRALAVRQALTSTSTATGKVRFRDQSKHKKQAARTAETAETTNKQTRNQKGSSSILSRSSTSATNAEPPKASATATSKYQHPKGTRSRRPYKTVEPTEGGGAEECPCDRGFVAPPPAPPPEPAE